MTFTNTTALFLALAFMAALPSVSVLAVSARAAAFGFGHGALTALGIVVGDLVFILLALFGLAVLVASMGESLHLVRYLGAAYLIGLGVALWRSPDGPAETACKRGVSWRSSFMTGLLITLGDQKAVLFYLGFLPAFVDLDALSPGDVGLVVVATILAVGGVKLAYAWAASRAGRRIGGGAARFMNRAAAGLLIAVGVWLVSTT